MPKSRLDSWKSIAEYLERSQRTVQRWHAFHALPVHHFGGRKGSVFAYTDEIDRWLLTLAEETPSAASDKDGLESRRQASFEFSARALELWETHSEESLNTIAGLYRRAIGQYPGNTAAMIGLANTMISAALEGVMDTALAYPCAKEALRRAEQLDPQNADAKCCSAWLDMIHERKWNHARSGFEEVLRKQPESAFALAGSALAFVTDGDLYNASYYAWKAWRRNTLVSSFGAIVCWTQYLAGDVAQALELVEQVQASGGGGALLGTIEALSLISDVRSEAHIKRLETIVATYRQCQTLQGALAYAYAASNQTDRAGEILHGLEQTIGTKKRQHGYGLAIALIGLKREQEAALWLEVEYAEGSLWSLGFGSDPVLQSLRGDRRYEALARKIGNSARSGAAARQPVVALARAV